MGAGFGLTCRSCKRTCMSGEVVRGAREEARLLRAGAVAPLLWFLSVLESGSALGRLLIHRYKLRDHLSKAGRPVAEVAGF